MAIPRTTEEAAAILGVPISATTDEIAARFKKLAQIYHPDLNPTAPSAGLRMTEITAARDLLLSRREPGSGTSHAHADRGPGGQSASSQHSRGRGFTVTPHILDFGTDPRPDVQRRFRIMNRGDTTLLAGIRTRNPAIRVASAVSLIANQTIEVPVRIDISHTTTRPDAFYEDSLSVFGAAVEERVTIRFRTSPETDRADGRADEPGSRRTSESPEDREVTPKSWNLLRRQKRVALGALFTVVLSVVAVSVFFALFFRHAPESDDSVTSDTQSLSTVTDDAPSIEQPAEESTSPVLGSDEVDLANAYALGLILPSVEQMGDIWGGLTNFTRARLSGSGINFEFHTVEDGPNITAEIYESSSDAASALREIAANLESSGWDIQEDEIGDSGIVTGTGDFFWAHFVRDRVLVGLIAFDEAAVRETARSIVRSIDEIRSDGYENQPGTSVGIEIVRSSMLQDLESLRSSLSRLAEPDNAEGFAAAGADLLAVHAECEPRRTLETRDVWQGIASPCLLVLLATDAILSGEDARGAQLVEQAITTLGLSID